MQQLKHMLGGDDDAGKGKSKQKKGKGKPLAEQPPEVKAVVAAFESPENSLFEYQQIYS